MTATAKRRIYKVTTGPFRGVMITRWDADKEEADRLAKMEADLLKGKLKFVKEI